MQALDDVGPSASTEALAALLPRDAAAPPAAAPPAGPREKIRRELGGLGGPPPVAARSPGVFGHTRIWEL